MKTYTVKIDDREAIRWYKEGTEILHRENGPAVERANGSKKWYLNGLLHREDGPAIEYADGCKDWYLNGKKYTEQELNEEIQRRNNSCNGKTIEIDGKKYRLSEV